MSDYYDDGCDDNNDYQYDDQYYDDDQQQQDEAEMVAENDSGWNDFLFFGIVSGFFNWLFK